MKKVLLSLLAVVVVLGLFAAAGYAGYRFGYAQGIQPKTTANGAPTNTNPLLRPFNNFGFGPQQMPMRRFRSERGFRRDGSFVRGFWLIPLLMVLGRLAVFVAVLVLIVWFIYWLVSRSGWRLTREPAVVRQSVETREPTEDNPPKTENE